MHGVFIVPSKGKVNLMFWTIVGALLFVFVGIPLILNLLTSKGFWILTGYLMIMGLAILGCLLMLKYNHFFYGLLCWIPLFVLGVKIENEN